MAKAVLFDVDGTLIDSNRLHVMAWVRSFARFGVDLPEDSVAAQIGKGGDQLMPVFLSPTELKRIGPDLEAYRGRLFEEEYLDRAQPFPGVRPLFERLRADGRKIVLASSGKAAELKRYQQAAGIEILVDAVVTADDVDHSKPAPDVFARAVEKIAPLTAADAIAIGDSPYDAQAASAAHLATIGLLSGGFAKADLLKAGCVAIYDDVAHLLADYDASPLGAGTA